MHFSSFGSYNGFVLSVNTEWQWQRQQAQEKPTNKKLCNIAGTGKCPHIGGIPKKSQFVCYLYLYRGVQLGQCEKKQRPPVEMTDQRSLSRVKFDKLLESCSDSLQRVISVRTKIRMTVIKGSSNSHPILTGMQTLMKHHINTRSNIRILTNWNPATSKSLYPGEKKRCDF